MLVMGVLAGCGPGGEAPGDDDSPSPSDDDSAIDDDVSADDDTGGDDDITDDDTSPDDDSTAIDPCKGEGFQQVSTDFSLPGGYPDSSFTATWAEADCARSGDQPAFSLVDLREEGRSSLLVTDSCTDAEVGRTLWWRHPLEGTGFTPSPLSYSLPEGFPEGALTATTRAADCDGVNDFPAFSLLGLDGDAGLDLVVTATCEDPRVGTDFWWVYSGGEDGFSPSPTAFSLPGGFPASSFVTTSAPPACSGEEGPPGFALLDLDGGEEPDLVVTRACGEEGSGTSYWSIFPNDGEGFSSSPTAFTLPSGEGEGAFERASRSTLDCENSPSFPAFTPYDIDADGERDLLVTGRCLDSDVGTLHWEVFYGVDTGFSPVPVLFGLPGGYPAGSFLRTSRTEDCGETGSPTAFLTNLDGQGGPDLVVSRACDDETVGTSQWRLHRHLDTGFDEARSFSLPPGFPAQTFAFPAGNLSCSAASLPAHSLWDADGSGQADLILTDTCKGDEVGTSLWRVYFNACPLVE